MADEDGYPIEAELQRLREWPHEDIAGWFAYAKSIGHWWPTEVFGWYEYEGKDDFKRPVHVWQISTGGWSGNEEIISEMRAHPIWFFTWHQHTRGGHYEFRLAVPMSAPASPRRAARPGGPVGSER